MSSGKKQRDKRRTAATLLMLRYGTERSAEACTRRRQEMGGRLLEAAQNAFVVPLAERVEQAMREQGEDR